MYKTSRYLVDEVQVAGIGTFAKRFIRLRTPAEAERPAVKRIISEAFKLAGRA